jgi:hypothetical protein
MVALPDFTFPFHAEMEVGRSCPGKCLSGQVHTSNNVFTNLEPPLQCCLGLFVGRF